MKRKRFLAVLLLCAVPAMVLGAATTYAQPPSPAIISSHVIESEDGSNVTNGPLMAGARYTVSFEINVGVVPPDTELSLLTPLEKAKGQDIYWRLENDYEGVDTHSWQPGRPTIEFDAVEGIAQFKLEGVIPSDYTSEKLSNEEYLHFARYISLVELSLGEKVLGEVEIQVKDQAIVAYERTLADKELLLQEANTDPTYAALAEDVISLAQDLSSRGYVQNAIDLLDTLPSTASDFPTIEDYQQKLTEKKDLLETVDTDPTYAALAEKVIALAENLSSEGYVQNAIDLLDTLPSGASDYPPPEKSFLPYIIGIAVLAVILIAFVGLFLRGRANSSFIRQQVDEEAGRLDVLSVRISKIDKQLGKDTEQVKEQLERIIGR